MAKFKNDTHQDLYLDLMRVLQNTDKDYQAFAYTASAIGKDELLKAVGERRVRHDVLQEISAPWSNSERAMIELAYWLFSGRNFYQTGEGGPRFTTISDIFYSLDSENARVAMQAMESKFL